MIRISDLTKKFDDICAADHINLEIPEGMMYGLLGTNGAGKTTFLKILAGILDADGGRIEIDGEEDIHSPRVREKLFYLPDDPYYFPNASVDEMLKFYEGQYPRMDKEGAEYIMDRLELDIRRPVRTFSKGMKRQAFLGIALCSGTDYLLCDEVFDGLDPVVTEVMKDLFRKEIGARKLTVIVASHKLNDLEDICENIAILHQGRIVTAGDMRGRNSEIHKFQCVLENKDADRVLKGELDIIRFHRDGDFVTIIARGQAKAAQEAVLRQGAALVKETAMSLEEVFIAEMEEKGYDIRKVLE